MAKSEKNDDALPDSSCGAIRYQALLFNDSAKEKYSSPSLIRELLLNGEKLTANIYSQINSV